MCDTTNSHSHRHGVRPEQEKAVADLREDLADELRLLTKYEAHLTLISAAGFPEAEEVAGTLARLRDEKKDHVASLFGIIGRLDLTQAQAFSRSASPVRVAT